MSTRSDNPAFWEPRYTAGETPWDFGGVPIALEKWLPAQSTPGRVLIPGCGAAHEVRAFHDAGWDVLAIDYAPAAVRRAQTGLGDLRDRVLLANFFTDDFGQSFDAIYERTFLCSMPRDRWPAYVARVAELLGERGLLIGHFYFGGNDDPPPYSLDEETQRVLFASRFRKLDDRLATDSLPMFAGRESWQVWQKRVALQVNRFANRRKQ